LRLKFVVEYTARKVRESQEELELTGTHHLLLYADGVNFGGGYISSKKLQKLCYAVLGRLVYKQIKLTKCP